MARFETDILISGAGIAGLTAAYAFGCVGFSVLCVDPAAIVVDEADENVDLRTTAFLQPAQNFLDKLGLWSRLSSQAAPLQIMRIVDAGGKIAEARAVSDFDARDISDAPFGWNLPNSFLRREISAALTSLPNVSMRYGVAVSGLMQRSSEAIVTLDGHEKIRAKLVIGADGRNSTIRQHAGITHKTWRYGQRALVCSAFHADSHADISTEIHRTGGPFTLVPLPDFEGRHRSSIVWMDQTAQTEHRLKMEVAEFNREMTERSAGLYGPLELAGRRGIWPMISQHADRLVAQRVALIAEAAHVVPPIGAQGLNMSLADISTLSEMVQRDPKDPGASKTLAAYEKARLADIRLRVRGIDLLNRASMAQNVTLRDLRNAGLKFLHEVKPIRKALMRKGLGLNASLDHST